MNIVRLILVLICILAPAGFSLAQEQLRPLEINPVIQKHNTTHKPSRLKSVNAPLQSIPLPFKDDFSYSSPYPDESLWANQNVFINSTLADTMLSIGIATFDNLDKTGRIYKSANLKSFSADTLTSHPIALNTSMDSIWLSFYFLPGGKGDPPSKNDSLILEFTADSGKTYQTYWIAHNHNDSLYVEQFLPLTNTWANSRYKLDTRKFRLAMLPITQTKYKNDGFQFRFRNTVSITSKDLERAGMCDLWHIDYVYLNRNRSFADTIYRDLTFYKPLPSQLTPYTSVPFNHYISGSSISKPIMEFHLRNNHKQTLIAQKYFRITELKNGLPTSNSLLLNLNKEGVSPFEFYMAYIESDKYITNETSDVTFETRAYFENIVDDEWVGNNEIKRIQEFRDYFSYDDGSSEAGYGLYSPNGIVAYKFTVNETDTLTGIRIYFNPTINEENKNFFFKLGVWADNRGTPGIRLYKDEDKDSRRPEKLGEFNDYILTTPIIIKEYESFYVGWYQLGENILNVGYDLNTNGKNFLFYNYDGNWRKSGAENGEILAGSLMLRPVFGNVTLQDTVSNTIKSTTVVISPNPVTDKEFITLRNLKEKVAVDKILFYNPIGQVVSEIKAPQPENINISAIPKGIYIVKVIYTDGTSGTNKLIKK